jgi:hypothetical protein
MARVGSKVAQVDEVLSLIYIAVGSEARTQAPTGSGDGTLPASQGAISVLHFYKFLSLSCSSTCLLQPLISSFYFILSFLQIFFWSIFPSFLRISIEGTMK